MPEKSHLEKPQHLSYETHLRPHQTYLFWTMNSKASESLAQQAWMDILEGHQPKAFDLRTSGHIPPTHTLISQDTTCSSEARLHFSNSLAKETAQTCLKSQSFCLSFSSAVVTAVVCQL